MEPRGAAWEGVSAAHAAIQRAQTVSADETNRERLRYDEELVLTLQLYQWTDEAWGLFADWIAGYGYNVITGWIFNKAIYSKMSNIGRPITRCPDEWLDEHEVTGLAQDTVAAAIAEFRRLLMGNVWDAGKGASLRTYFVGQCLRQFANIYRSWHLAKEREGKLRGDLTVDDIHAPDPVEVVARRAEAERVLHQMPETTARIFEMHAQEFTHAEIADELGLTNAKAVENIIRREKAKWNPQHRERNASAPR